MQGKVSREELREKADAAEAKAEQTKDPDRCADLLQLAILLRWLADYDGSVPESVSKTNGQRRSGSFRSRVSAFFDRR
jgi:hypothetical protein